MARFVRLAGALCILMGLGFAASAAHAQAVHEVAAQSMDRAIYTYLLADQLEHRFNKGQDSLYWNAEGWVGGDTNRLWLKTEGEKPSRDPVSRAEIQLLYSRAVTPFWDLQAGARYDIRPRPQRGFAVFGAQGLAPMRVEVEARAFVSDRGDLSARLEAEYEFLLTQRLVLQPRLETNLALQQARDIGVGRGLGDIELGLRLRYELTRQFAPYIGLSWERKFGRTADFARDEGEQAGVLAFTAGVRFWL